MQEDASEHWKLRGWDFNTVMKDHSASSSGYSSFTKSSVHRDRAHSLNVQFTRTEYFL